MPDLWVRNGSAELAIAGGVVVAAAPEGAPVLDATGLTVLPGVIDLQVNGVAGIDLTAEPTPAVGGRRRARGVRRHRVAADRDHVRPRRRASMPSPRSPGELPRGGGVRSRWACTSRVRSSRPPARARIPGDGCASRTLTWCEGWSREAGVLMVTVAPELPGRSGPHPRPRRPRRPSSRSDTPRPTPPPCSPPPTPAPRSVTHLGNAMPPMLSREPGPVGAALGGTRLVAGVIVDGHHLHPDVVRLMWRALGSRAVPLRLRHHRGARDGGGADAAR